jgi:hypothetical protein
MTLCGERMSERHCGDVILMTFTPLSLSTFAVHAGAGANATINESCQFDFVASVDHITITMLHKSKVIGRRSVPIAEACHRIVIGVAQLEDENGYGVGTAEYEIEVTGLSVRFICLAIAVQCIKDVHCDLRFILCWSIHPFPKQHTLKLYPCCTNSLRLPAGTLASALAH